MKNLLQMFILSLTIVLTSQGLMSYAQDLETPMVKDITKAFEAPPDFLDATLQKIDNIDPHKNQQLNENDSAAEKPELTEIDYKQFKNPFIPQLPKVEKPVVPVNLHTETPEPVKPPIVIPEFTVSGLVWNSKKPAAILNGQIVAIGDQINSWAIADITKDGVHVTFEDQEIWVKPIVDPNNPTQRNPRNRR